MPADAKTNAPLPHMRFWPAAVGIYVCALVVRGVHLWQIRSAPFFELLVGDARGYDLWARRIAGGDWIGQEVFYQAPLYPYFLATIYATVGDDPLSVRVVQAILGAGACVLLADAGRRLFSRAAGIMAGLMLAFYAPAIFFDGLLQKSALDLFFLCLVLWLFSTLIERPRVWTWAVAGASLGCLVLTRENALVLAAPMLAWLITPRGVPRPRRLAFATIFLVALAAVLVPVGVRNAVVGGEFHLTTAQFGPNLFIGNNENATGAYKPLRARRSGPEYERLDATELAETALGRELTPAQVSRYWTGRTVDSIVADVPGWLALMSLKVALLFNRIELLDAEDQYLYAEWSWPLRVTGFVTHFGVVVPLAIFGLWATWARRGTLWPFYLMMGLYAATVVLFYVMGRYRFPLVPFLLLFAAGGLTRLPVFVRERHARLAGMVALAAVVVLCNWPIADKNQMRATMHYNVGVGLERLGDSDEAVTHFRRAVALSPLFAAAHHNLAVVLAGRGELAEAAEHFERALTIDTGYGSAWTALGNLRFRQDDLSRAGLCYERALQADDGDANALYGLGNVCARLERWDDAVAHYTGALAIDPDHTGVRTDLGNVLLLNGDLAGARAQYELVLEVDPDHAQALNNLGSVFEQRGDLETAERHYERAVELAPDFTGARENLARVRRLREGG